MKVKTNKIYVYDPVPMDIYDARTTLINGDLVKVIKLPGCPPPNTMDHCHVEDINGKFRGLVCCNSLLEQK